MFFTPAPQGSGPSFNPFKAIVSPRPIGWISSISKSGDVNLAPYSFFNAISDSPPMVGFSASPSDNGDGEKDSLAYIREAAEFVVNIVSKAQIDAMNASSAALPRGISEFGHAGLEVLASEIVAAPGSRARPVNWNVSSGRSSICRLPPTAAAITSLSVTLSASISIRT